MNVVAGAALAFFAVRPVIGVKTQPPQKPAREVRDGIGRTVDAPYGPQVRASYENWTATDSPAVMGVTVDDRCCCTHEREQLTVARVALAVALVTLVVTVVLGIATLIAGPPAAQRPASPPPVVSNERIYVRSLYLLMCAGCGYGDETHEGTGMSAALFAPQTPCDLTIACDGCARSR